MSYSCIGSGLLRTENVSELDETVREHKKNPALVCCCMQSGHVPWLVYPARLISNPCSCLLLILCIQKAETGQGTTQDL